MDLTYALEMLQELPPWVAYAALFGGAFGEYVFPPIPGDLIVLAGVLMATVFGWPLIPVFLLVTIGAILGAMAADAGGRALRKSGRVETLGPAKQRALGLVLARFERFGTPVLLLNRFFPGIRGFFFLASGLTGIPRWKVAFWASLGAVLWNTLLVGIGYTLGSNLELLERVIMTNGAVAGTVVALGLAIVAYKTWRAMKEPEAA